MGQTKCFLNKRFQGFTAKILRVVSLLGEKLISSTPLRQSKFHESLIFLFIFVLSFPKPFQKNLNYASIPNIVEVMKFCNLGDQSFEQTLKYVRSKATITLCNLSDAILLKLVHLCLNAFSLIQMIYCEFKRICGTNCTV